MAISKKPFGVMPDGREVTQYTLTNARGASVSVINFGSILTNVRVPDRNGVLDDVVLGFDNLASYLAEHGSMGDTVGRYGNRIAQARFTIDGVTYQLDANNHGNHLHGVLGKQLWDADPVETAVGDLLRLHYVSPDGEDKFPGTLDVTVTYGWDDACNLSIRYEATTDKPTLCNMTNHSYFNLAGCTSGSIHDHVLTVEADAVTSVADNTLIPTGGYTPVAGTPFDMRHGLRLGDGLNATHSCPQMTFAGGYDHNFVLRKGEAMGLAARLYDPKSGRVMETLTDQPGVQVYTACGTDIPGGKGGTHYGKYCAVCPGNPAFPRFAESPAVHRHDGSASRRKVRHDDDLRVPHGMIRSVKSRQGANTWTFLSRSKIKNSITECAPSSSRRIRFWRCVTNVLRIFTCPAEG